jgi:cyclic nucleotide-binding protein
VRLSPGEGVHEGDGCLYLVAEGEGRLLSSESSRTSAAVVLRQGDAFGVSALLQDGSGMTLEAMGPMRLMVLDAENVAYLAGTISTVAAALAGSGNPVVPAGGSRLARIPWSMTHAVAGKRGDGGEPTAPMGGLN